MKPTEEVQKVDVEQVMDIQQKISNMLNYFVLNCLQLYFEEEKNFHKTFSCFYYY